MTIQVTSAAVERFVALSGRVEEEAGAFGEVLVAAGRDPEPARVAGGQARQWSADARAGRLPRFRGVALGLSRALGDHSVAEGADGLWDAIRDLEAFWSDELHRGDFEVRDA